MSVFIKRPNPVRLYTGNIPKMVSDTELWYANWIMQHNYCGKGAAIEMGCYLGATTIAMADGLRKNRNTSRPFIVYDNFLWDTGYMSHDNPAKEHGSSFHADFEKNTMKWSDCFLVQNVDLESIKWDGGDIEWMFVDAWKSKEVTMNCVREFLPHLLPYSFVYHQDYVFAAPPGIWLHVVMYRLRDYFWPCMQLDGYGVVFMSTRNVPLKACLEAADLNGCSSDEMVASIDASLQYVTQNKNELEKLKGMI